ncbi:hypothetical protein ACP4OV_003022 [Aristida adscensionis]
MDVVPSIFLDPVGVAVAIPAAAASHRLQPVAAADPSPKAAPAPPRQAPHSWRRPRKVAAVAEAALALPLPPSIAIQGEVKYWFEAEAQGSTILVLHLHTSHPEKDDPYSLSSSELSADVICTHEQLALLRLRESDVPARFFVYSFFPFAQDSASTVEVELLPNAVPEISWVQSLGLLRDKMDSQRYVVANLVLERNPKTKTLEFLLHRWLHPSSSLSPQHRERVTLPYGVSFSEWQTDKVIPFLNALLWVDLRQGILRCTNPLNRKGAAASFDFVRLPPTLEPLPRDKGRRRPETFRSIGSYKGKLQFVSLCIPDGVTVKVEIWTLDGEDWNSYRQISLHCPTLWSDMNMLQPAPSLLQPRNKSGKQIPWKESGNHMPCFPVLSTDKEDILCLTMATRDDKHAWLLEIDTSNCKGALKGAVNYPGFCDHHRPPHPTNLSNYLQLMTK